MIYSFSDLLYDVKIQSKKRKYFSEKSTTKNIFKKLLHPSYYERRIQFRKLFGDVVDEADLFLTCRFSEFGNSIFLHNKTEIVRFYKIIIILYQMILLFCLEKIHDGFTFQNMYIHTI